MLVGRNVEIQRLNRAFLSTEAEFVVIYGRRRVGKTYLIRQFFTEQPCLFFQATGLQKGNLKKQLENFAFALSETFTNNVLMQTPASWDDAFRSLTRLIESRSANGKTIIFLDELPWIASKKSGLLEALNYHWNHAWSKNPNIILVACGSSASWLINNIIYNKGGLHNRCTCEIKLDPFTLSETRSYFLSKNITLNENHILEIYMALGGIPYYLKYVKPGLSAHENIQQILFDDKAPLKDEFTKLFQSLFKSAQAYIELITVIARKKIGLSRTELAVKAKLSQGGGRLTKRLQQLMQTNFIVQYIPYEKSQGEYYKVIDEFCLFYLYWMKSVKNKVITRDHWLKQCQKPEYHVWSGYAFEAVCHKHIHLILGALHITTAEHISAWRMTAKTKTKQGAQIDLLIDRTDNAITICEIKYTDKPFLIDKTYADKLQKKMVVFSQETSTKKQLFLNMISANGIVDNNYSRALINASITLKDLFE